MRIQVYRLPGQRVRMSDDRTEPFYKRGKSLRILVVEDHGETLQTLAHLLTHFGHEISVADSTQSALEIVESKEFDVVLSDIGCQTEAATTSFPRPSEGSQSKA